MPFVRTSFTRIAAGCSDSRAVRNQLWLKRYGKPDHFRRITEIKWMLFLNGAWKNSPMDVTIVEVSIISYGATQSPHSCITFVVNISVNKYFATMSSNTLYVYHFARLRNKKSPISLHYAFYHHNILTGRQESVTREAKISSEIFMKFEPIDDNPI